jgi:hypothetical protein
MCLIGLEWNGVEWEWELGWVFRSAYVYIEL